MSEEKEPFVERWSRLKREQAEAPAVSAPAVPALAEAKSDEPAAQLPPIEELKPDSDFKPFMDPKVDPATRRAALKKLFVDAHFNAPDPFEPYSADFTVAEPIPADLLKTLNHARKLLFDDAQGAQPADSAAVPPSDKDAAGGKDA
ncbi:MAG TPA: DUF3306 domain-containing protein [Burkholderiales bacterium]|nr:DUF3306 domain-containing protein [Burkholderiales bacterium]